MTPFFRSVDVWAVKKYVHLVDLVKSFPTNVYLQNLASMQPRTSSFNFDARGVIGRVRAASPRGRKQTSSPWWDRHFVDSECQEFSRRLFLNKWCLHSFEENMFDPQRNYNFEETSLGDCPLLLLRLDSFIHGCCWIRRVVVCFWQNFGKISVVFGCIKTKFCK